MQCASDEHFEVWWQGEEHFFTTYPFIRCLVKWTWAHPSPWKDKEILETISENNTKTTKNPITLKKNHKNAVTAVETIFQSVHQKPMACLCEVNAHEWFRNEPEETPRAVRSSKTGSKTRELGNERHQKKMFYIFSQCIWSPDDLQLSMIFLQRLQGAENEEAGHGRCFACRRSCSSASLASLGRGTAGWRATACAGRLSWLGCWFVLEMLKASS